MAIDPPLLLKNAVITTIAVKMPKHAMIFRVFLEIKEWQIKLIGNDLVRFR